MTTKLRWTLWCAGVSALLAAGVSLSVSRVANTKYATFEDWSGLSVPDCTSKGNRRTIFVEPPLAKSSREVVATITVVRKLSTDEIRNEVRGLPPPPPDADYREVLVAIEKISPPPKEYVRSKMQGTDLCLDPADFTPGSRGTVVGTQTVDSDGILTIYPRSESKKDEAR